MELATRGLNMVKRIKLFPILKISLKIDRIDPPIFFAFCFDDIQFLFLPIYLALSVP
jgi:hypothetical protein